MKTSGEKVIEWKVPRPMPHQMPVLDSRARFKVVVCGRRWGKTCLSLLATVLGHGEGRLRGAIDGATIWWVAPDYPTAEGIWRDLKRLCQPIWTHKDEVGRRVELPGGGSVAIRSAHDPEGLVAVGLDGLVIDEAARVDELAWHKSLRPTLSDTGGWAIFISTPNGFNWFHDLFNHAVERPGWDRWQRPTSDNPLVPQSELDAAQLDAPVFFAQEYLASFMTVAGAEFMPQWFGPGIWFTDWPKPHEILLTVVSLDPSKGKDARVPNDGKLGDYSAYTILKLAKDGTIYVDADMDQRRPTTQIVADGLEICRVHRPDAFAVEINQFQSLFAGEFLRAAKEQRMLLPVWGWDNRVNKEVRIRRLAPMLAGVDGKVRFKANSRGAGLLVAQLRDFRSPPHPSGYHDDGCFVAGTLIETEMGPRPIEEVRVGDYVLTRSGYARVAISGCTGIKDVIELQCSNGKSLIGTANHPVFDGNDFTSMHLVDIMYTCQENTLLPSRKLSSSTASHSADTPTQNNGRIACTSLPTRPIDVMGSARCTRRSGKRRTGLFQRGIKSTIGMKIHSTTHSKTLSASPRPSTTPDTVRGGVSEPRARRVVKVWRERSLLPSNGINPLLAKNGTSITEKSHGKIECPLMWSASSAGSRTRPIYRIEPSFAPADAGSGLTRRTVDMRPVYVFTKKRLAKAAVHNLSVEGPHEYFANGFLVHNCDSMEMGVRMLLHLLRGSADGSGPQAIGA